MKIMVHIKIKCKNNLFNKKYMKKGAINKKCRNLQFLNQILIIFLTLE